MLDPVRTKGSQLQLAAVPNGVQRARAAYCRPRAWLQSFPTGALEATLGADRRTPVLRPQTLQAHNTNED